jgi:hypothetical protein
VTQQRKRILFIVSRKQVDLLPRLEQECRGGGVEIIVDRRIQERRRPGESANGGRRERERRQHANASELDLIGIAVVVLPEQA